MSELGDFSEQAAAYGARPGYPSALIEQLLALVAPPAGAQIADVAAGTGIFTAQLSGRGFSITAVEPNAAMRAQAPALSDTHFVDGRFERLGLPDTSQHWITVAQAFHWAEPETALPELARALVPGGWLTLLWNDRQPERLPLLQESLQLLKSHVPSYREDYRDKDWSATLSSSAHFDRVVRHRVEHVVRMSPERYVRLWQSVNRIAVLATPGALARFHAELLSLVAERAGSEIAVPYACSSWSAHKSGARDGM